MSSWEHQPLILLLNILLIIKNEGYNRIWKQRLVDIGVLDDERSKRLSLTGPMLRGSGVKYDIRKEEPYELYSELDFDIPVSERCDSYGRFRLYMEEMNMQAFDPLAY